MTLLTKSKNSKAKNFDWNKKQIVYTDTNLLMTRLVCAQEKITAAYLENRQKHIVETLIKALDL